MNATVSRRAATHLHAPSAIPSRCTAAAPWLLAVILLLAAPMAARAQSADEKEVVAVIEKFFAGMLARDTAMMRTTFDPAARLLGIATPREGQPTIRATTMDQFLAGVARGQGEGANERIHSPEVRIDGNLATVWTFYTLHVGERFIHCGYDAFQLLRMPDGWKIVSVADTRRTEGCEVGGG